MVQKIKIEDREYAVENLSDAAKSNVAALQFATKRITEIKNMQALLQRAKISYVESLKIEIISQKAGALFEED